MGERENGVRISSNWADTQVCPYRYKIDEKYEIIKQIQGEETVGANLSVRPTYIRPLLDFQNYLVPRKQHEVLPGNPLVGLIN